MTFAEAAHMGQPTSLWYRALERRAAPLRVDDWLLVQANARGFRGAWTTHVAAPDPTLSNEEIVVGLLAPRTEVDARVVKLVVRMFQSGALQLKPLTRLATLERALGPIHWVLTLVPAAERNAAVDEARAAFFAPPRGFRGIQFRYEPSRLVRRPGRKDAWRLKPS